MKEERKEKFWTMVGGIGIILLWIGACAMDGEDLILPALMILTGLGLCYGSARILEK